MSENDSIAGDFSNLFFKGQRELITTALDVIGNTVYRSEIAKGKDPALAHQGIENNLMLTVDKSPRYWLLNEALDNVHHVDPEGWWDSLTGSLPTATDDITNFVAEIESSNRHRDANGNLNTSSKGAKGVTQIMPDTAKDPGYGIPPLKGETEADYREFSKNYLTAALRENGGDVEKAVASYNAGIGDVKSAVSRGEKEGKDWKYYLTPGDTGLPL